MKKLSLILLITLSSALALSAQAERTMPPVTVRDSQTFGLGGPHVAYTDSVYGLFVNPAAIRRASRGSAFDLSVSAPQVIDIVNRLEGVDFGNPTSLIGLFREDDGTLKFGPGVALQFPLAIGYAGRGFGFGIWDQIVLDLRFKGDTAYVGLRADFVTSFGVATSVFELGGHSVDVGVALKPFVRVMTDGVDPIKATDLLSKLNDMDTLIDQLLDGAGMPVIAGLGVDAGLMYRFRQWASLGISFNDIVTRGAVVTDLSDMLPVDGVSGVDKTISYVVPFTLNVGAAASIRLNDFLPGLPGIVGDTYLAVMADWKDILNQHWGSAREDLVDSDGNVIRNPILNLSFGAELGLFRFLRVRAGINEMLPAFGVGLHFGAFQISSSIFGVELGNEPGQFSSYEVNLSISIRPQSKREKAWPWNGPIVNQALGIR
jgi:hypothetical protein